MANQVKKPTKPNKPNEPNKPEQIVTDDNNDDYISFTGPNDDKFHLSHGFAQLFYEQSQTINRLVDELLNCKYNSDK